jgi:hypothetical protein
LTFWVGPIIIKQKREREKTAKDSYYVPSRKYIIDTNVIKLTSE